MLGTCCISPSLAQAAAEKAGPGNTGLSLFRRLAEEIAAPAVPSPSRARPLRRRLAVSDLAMRLHRSQQRGSAGASRRRLPASSTLSPKGGGRSLLTRLAEGNMPAPRARQPRRLGSRLMQRLAGARRNRAKARRRAAERPKRSLLDRLAEGNKPGPQARQPRRRLAVSSLAQRLMRAQGNRARARARADRDSPMRRLAEEIRLAEASGPRRARRSRGRRQHDL